MQLLLVDFHSTKFSLDFEDCVSGLGLKLVIFLQNAYCPVAYDVCHDMYGEPGTHSRSAVNAWG